MSKKLELMKEWWRKNYFQTSLYLYLAFFLQRAYLGAYDTRHEFLNGFTQELFGFVSLVPASIAMGLFMISIAGAYVLEKKDIFMGYTRMLKAMMVLSVFYAMLRSGLFEPIRQATEYLINTWFLDIRLIDVAQPLIDVSEATDFSFELVFISLLLIILNAFRYFLYLNVSVLYFLGSIGVSIFVGNQTYSVIRGKFKESEKEKADITILQAVTNQNAQKVVPFRPKEQQ